MTNKIILSPRSEGDKKGFTDGNGNWIIHPQYEEVDVFREDVCWVKLNDKWGLIDRKGEFLITPRFDDAREFDQGLANVKIGPNWGVTDKSGNIRIRPEFDFIDSFRNGIAYVKKNGKYGFVFLDDNRIIPAVFDDVRGFSEGMAAVKTDGGWGYIDRTGKMIISPQYFKAGKFRNGKAFVEIEESGGFIDKNGNAIDEFEEKYHEDKWSYEDEPWFDRGIRTLHGFIDKKGDYIIKPKFMATSSFDANGLAAVEIDRKWGVINKSGAYVIEPKYDYLYSEGENIYRVSLHGKEYFIDIDENPVIFDRKPYSSGLYEEPEDQDFETIILDEKYGVKNKVGEIIIKPKYDYLFYDHKEEVFVVRKNYKWGLLDKKGTVLIKPKYETLRFNEGLAPVPVKGRWGFINKNGEMVIQPHFDKAEEFENGYALINLNRKYGIIDKSGNYIIKPLFSNIGKRFENGYLRVAIPENGDSYQDLWGVMDENGKYVVSPEYEYLMPSVNEDMARIMKGESFGFVDCMTGRMITPIYNYVWDFSNGLAHIRLTEGQIEEGISKEPVYGEGKNKSLAFWQKKYDNWEEKRTKNNKKKPALPSLADLFNEDYSEAEESEEELPF